MNHQITETQIASYRRLVASDRHCNPSALGWVGIGIGATVAVGLVLVGVVFYRLTQL